MYLFINRVKRTYSNGDRTVCELFIRKRKLGRRKQESVKTWKDLPDMGEKKSLSNRDQRYIY